MIKTASSNGNLLNWNVWFRLLKTQIEWGRENVSTARLATSRARESRFGLTSNISLNKSALKNLGRININPNRLMSNYVTYTHQILKLFFCHSQINRGLLTLILKFSNSLALNMVWNGQSGTQITAVNWSRTIISDGVNFIVQDNTREQTHRFSEETLAVDTDN